MIVSHYACAVIELYINIFSRTINLYILLCVSCMVENACDWRFERIFYMKIRCTSDRVYFSAYILYTVLLQIVDKLNRDSCRLK